MARIRIAESVMQKAGAFGLQEHDHKLARLLKKMTRLSAIATRNKYDGRRRYGAFILTLAEDGTLVDINTNSDDAVCIRCLGTCIEGNEVCSCVISGLADQLALDIEEFVITGCIKGDTTV